MMLDLHGPGYITEVVLIVVCVCCVLCVQRHCTLCTCPQHYSLNDDHTRYTTWQSLFSMVLFVAEKKLLNEELIIRSETRDMIWAGSGIYIYIINTRRPTHFPRNKKKLGCTHFGVFVTSHTPQRSSCCCCVGVLYAVSHGSYTI